MTSEIKARLSKLASHFRPSMSASVFSDVPVAPPDALFDLVAAVKADSFPDKVDLSVGAYRTDEGKPWILPVVSKAKKKKSSMTILSLTMSILVLKVFPVLLKQLLGCFLAMIALLLVNVGM